MRMTLIAPPAEPPVSIDEAKEHLRIAPEVGDEDQLILRLIDAATQHLDGYRGVLGRCLVTQTWKAEITRLGERLSLPFPDVVVQSATFTDGLPGTLAWVWHESLAMPALIPTGGWGRPVAVTFTAGFGPPAAVPEPLKLAILLLVDHWFHNRGAIGQVGGAVELGFDSLIAPYRWRRL